jgi:hypothetical protein
MGDRLAKKIQALIDSRLPFCYGDIEMQLVKMRIMKEVKCLLKSYFEKLMDMGMAIFWISLKNQVIDSLPQE